MLLYFHLGITIGADLLFLPLGAGTITSTDCYHQIAHIALALGGLINLHRSCRSYPYCLC